MPIQKQRGKTVDCVCAYRGCKKPFKARVADRNRGWGRFCNKACKAKEQESRTHQNAAYHQQVHVSDGSMSLSAGEEYGHVGSFEENS